MTNKKHIWIAILFIVIGVLAFTLAGTSTDNNNEEVGLYFFDKSGYAISPQYTEITAETDNQLCEEIANALIKGPEGKEFLPIMSKDVRFNYVTLSDGTVTVDFSNEYPENNLMCTYAVIKTFSQLTGITHVMVTEGGNQIMGADGEPLGFVAGGDINTESNEDTATGVRLYFANSEKTELVMEYRKINIVDTQPVEQYIVTELIKGPKIKGNERLLAQDTKVLSVETIDKICYVNFKDGFLEKNRATPGGGRLLVESVVESLTGLNNVNGVQFLIEGKKTEKLGDTDISGLFLEKEVEVEK